MRLKLEQSHWSLELTVQATSENAQKLQRLTSENTGSDTCHQSSPICNSVSSRQGVFQSLTDQRCRQHRLRFPPPSLLYRCIVTTSSLMPHSELLTLSRHRVVAVLSIHGNAREAWKYLGRHGNVFWDLLKCVWNVEWKQTVAWNGDTLAVTDNGLMDVLHLPSAGVSSVWLHNGKATSSRSHSCAIQSDQSVSHACPCTVGGSRSTEHVNLGTERPRPARGNGANQIVKIVLTVHD